MSVCSPQSIVRSILSFDIKPSVCSSVGRQSFGMSKIYKSDTGSRHRSDSAENSKKLSANCLQVDLCLLDINNER